MEEQEAKAKKKRPNIPRSGKPPLPSKAAGKPDTRAIGRFLPATQTCRLPNRRHRRLSPDTEPCNYPNPLNVETPPQQHPTPQPRQLECWRKTSIQTIPERWRSLQTHRKNRGGRTAPKIERHPLPYWNRGDQSQSSQNNAQSQNLQLLLFLLLFIRYHYSSPSRPSVSRPLDNQSNGSHNSNYKPINYLSYSILILDKTFFATQFTLCGIRKIILGHEIRC